MNDRLRLTRRQFLRELGLGIGGTALSCSSNISLLCPHDEQISDLSAPLTIDVHAHVFNGSDLQIKEFIDQVVAKSKTSELHGLTQGLGNILQGLGWNLAPNADDELKTLR